MMSLNPFSAAQHPQPSHYNHYSSSTAPYAYLPTMPSRPSHTNEVNGTEEEGGHLSDRIRSGYSTSSSMAAQGFTSHRPSASTTTSPNPFVASPLSPVDKRAKGMTKDGGQTTTSSRSKSPNQSKRRKRPSSDEGAISESDRKSDQGKEEAGGPGNVTMFQCRGFGDCQMVFTRSEHLARHVRKHTGERPFRCHCGKSFSRLDNLRQHAQTVHADEQDRNEVMMQELTSLHSSLAASAAQNQVAHAQVLNKTGTAATLVGQGNTPIGSTRRKSSVAAKGTASALSKKRASAPGLREGKRGSIVSQSTITPTHAAAAAAAGGGQSPPSGPGYYVEQRGNLSPTSNGTFYHSNYPNGPVPAAGQSNHYSLSAGSGGGHGFQYARPPSSSGPYSAFAANSFNHPTGPSEAGYYSNFDHSSVNSPYGPTGTTNITSNQIGPHHSSYPTIGNPVEYNGYSASVHPFANAEVNDWRTQEVGPRGEEYYGMDGNTTKSSSSSSQFQSTLSAHLAMRTPVLRPGRVISPPPSTSHSVRPGSSSSVTNQDRPILPPLSSLSRPGTSHSTTAAPAPLGFASNSRRPSLIELGQMPPLPGLGGGDDKRPYTSPSDQHHLGSLQGNNAAHATRPILPSVRTTSSIRPGSRGSVFEPPSLSESGMAGRPSSMHSSSGLMVSSYRRASASSAGDGVHVGKGGIEEGVMTDRLRVSPTSSHSPFRFQPPPLSNQATATTSSSHHHHHQQQQGGLGVVGDHRLSLSRPVSRDRVSFGTLPSLSNTLDSLKRSREAASLRGKEEDYAVKRLRPFTSGDLPAPPRFGASRNAKVVEDDHKSAIQTGDIGARRVSIASLVDANEERPTTMGSLFGSSNNYNRNHHNSKRAQTPLGRGNESPNQCKPKEEQEETDELTAEV